jgi:hypothetical protein
MRCRYVVSPLVYFSNHAAPSCRRCRQFSTLLDHRRVVLPIRPQRRSKPSLFACEYALGLIVVTAGQRGEQDSGTIANRGWSGVRRAKGCGLLKRVKPQVRSA